MNADRKTQILSPEEATLFGALLRSAANEVRLSKILVAVTTIILPAALGFITNRLSSIIDRLGGNVDEIQRKILLEDKNLFWWLFWIFLGLQVLFALIGLFRPSTNAEALDAIATLTTEKRNLSLELHSTRDQRDRYLAITRSTKDALAVMFASFEGNRTDEISSVQQEVDFTAILESVYEMRDQIFKYRSVHSLYNLAIYLYDDSDRMLKVKWRRCHPGIKTQDRPWKAGIGHIGQCFLQQQVIITPDLCDGRYPNSTDDDKKYYRSAAAVPILDGGQAIGVFVVTSNDVGQFGKFDSDGEYRDDEIRDTMETIGNMLSIYRNSTQHDQHDFVRGQKPQSAVEGAGVQS